MLVISLTTKLYFKSKMVTSTLTEFSCSFVNVDDRGFGRIVGHRAPGGQGSLTGVKLLCEELLQLHANLYQVRGGGAGDDHLEYVPLQVSMYKDLTGGDAHQRMFGMVEVLVDKLV